MALDISGPKLAALLREWHAEVVKEHDSVCRNIGSRLLNTRPGVVEEVSAHEREQHNVRKAKMELIEVILSHIANNPELRKSD